MARFNSKLDNVRIAAPCPANWDSMYGNERVRFCEECQLNVYNLSAMSRADAEHLVAQAEGRLCVRYYRRRDGSIITQNCPIGLRALKRRLSRVATAIATSVLSFVAGVVGYRITTPSYTTGRMVIGDVYKPIPPSQQGTFVVSPATQPDIIMGKMRLAEPQRSPVRTVHKHR
jgi:hypothetical protein